MDALVLDIAVQIMSALSMALLGICVIAVYFYRQATRNAA